MILVALMFGYGLVETAIASVIVGAVAAPFTRRAEARGLAARDRGTGP